MKEKMFSSGKKWKRKKIAWDSKGKKEKKNYKTIKNSTNLNPNRMYRSNDDEV